jgi:hypothetical protein
MQQAVSALHFTGQIAAEVARHAGSATEAGDSLPRHPALLAK